MRHSLPLFTVKEPNLAILSQDPHWLVVVKPRGLTATPSPSSAQSLLSILKEQGYPGLRTVGRLDRAAGGVMILGRDKVGQRLLTSFWHHPSTEKVYLAGTYAAPDPPEGEVDLPIGEGRRYGAMRLGVGKAARTRYRLVGRSPLGFYWVEAFPITGRRHQIRLHLGSRGAPVVGDGLYWRFFARKFPGRWSLAEVPPPSPPERIELYCVRIVVRGLGIIALWDGIIPQDNFLYSPGETTGALLPRII